jgi:hypothetical protein
LALAQSQEPPSRGIYYLSHPTSVEFLEPFAMRRVTIALPGLWLREDASNVLSPSPDDRWILLSVPFRSVRLMLASNFR